MKITFIQTGGTIDKDYPHTTKGWAFEFGEPASSRILERLQPSFEYEIITACQKDSLEISEVDRANLVELIHTQGGQNFIITHGTDTMIETAIYLNQRIDNKLIVLTGAMRPERFTNSEADINIGCAIATANLMPRGVFVAMHGIVKSASDIKRDLKTGQFF